MFPSSRTSLLALTSFALCGPNSWAAHPSQGLWVGEVALNAVNEATGAVGNSNTYEFEDPEVPTPTSDTAFLRLILHVNGAGQARLLKSVAIMEGDTLADGSQDVILITDPTLYASNPGIAKRIASAFYDFGDQQAVTAVQMLIDTATDTAVARAIAGDTQADIRTKALTALSGVVGQANVEPAYLDRGTGATSFLTTGFFSLSDVHAIADQVASLMHAGTKTAADFSPGASAATYNPFPSDPLGGKFSTVVAAAAALRTASFYGDTRGMDAIVGIVVAAAKAVNGADLTAKQAAARQAAEGAWHNAADVTQAFNRFIAGNKFVGLPAAIPPVAVQAALDAHGRGDSTEQIKTAVRNALLSESGVAAAYTEATTILSASLWSDPRASRAVDTLVNSAVDSAAAEVAVTTVETLLKKAVTDDVASAFDAIKAAPVFASAPSSTYSGFVTDSDYQNAATTAATKAAAEASFQYGAGVKTSRDLKFLTNRAVPKALVGIRKQAAALPQDTIPLSGGLEAGDSLGGTIYLPALAPTNPFMHREHPDHTEGNSITRRISMTVDAGGAGRSGYGVSRLSGIYQEEISGLHKPLGPGQDVGLKTQGTFTLNRLSFAGSLNF